MNNSICITLKNNQKFSHIIKIKDLFTGNTYDKHKMEIEMTSSTTEEDVIKFFATRGLDYDRFLLIEDTSHDQKLVALCSIASIELNAQDCITVKDRRI
jgi:hypothetical protein